MNRLNIALIAGLAVGLGCSAPPPETDAVLYEGATLIVGDGSAAIENGAFVVEDGTFAAVGSAGEVEAPAGATTVDLSGMTVMPAIIDTHIHSQTTREGIIEDIMARPAWGVSAVLSLGRDRAEVPIEIRDEDIPGAALFRSAGLGASAPEPERDGVSHWVTTEEEGREAVREEAARGITIFKIWVDSRNGLVQKLPLDVAAAIIDEAHQHDLRVTAHIFDQADAKALLRADIDSFAHGIRDQDVDDEIVEMFKERPDFVLVPNLPGRGVETDLSWLEGQIPAERFEALQAANADNPSAQETFGIQARNLARLSAEGVIIGLGSDGNDAFAPHVEMEDMVAAGLTPMEVITAATQNSAAFMELDDMGTIATGKRADFIVLEANPLDDITNTRRIGAVYLEGEQVER